MGCGSVQKISYENGKFDASSLVMKLKGADAVFFVGAAGEEVQFLKEAAATGFTPNVFLLGAMIGRDLLGTMPLSFKDKVFVAFPTVPGDITTDGLAEFRALETKYRIAARHRAAQVSSYAAAKVFLEGLKRAGQDLSREKLITALEGLNGFNTGLTPHITFGPNRRIGAAGAYVLKVDPEKKEFVAAGSWVEAY